MLARRIVRCSAHVGRSLGKRRNNTTATKDSENGSKVLDIMGILVFSGISVGAFGLGCWQVQRYYWKVDLIAQIKDKAIIKPETIADDVNLYDVRNGLQGQVVSICGTFDHKNEVLLGPRSSPAGLYEAAQGMATNAQGYYVLVPLLRKDGTTVIVNRGWVPVDRKKWKRPEGNVSLTCIVSQPEKKAQFSPENSPKTGILLWLEQSAVLEACNVKFNTKTSTGVVSAEGEGEKDKDYELVILEAVSLDEDTVSTELADGTRVTNKKKNKITFPAPKNIKQLHTQSVDPLTHGAYAFTWFSLAAAGLLMTYIKFRKNKRILGKVRKV